ncbi:MAG: hypothetical protein ACJA1Z_001277 [Patiriisocius sp.]|jgi:hypothetical protein
MTKKLATTALLLTFFSCSEDKKRTFSNTNFETQFETSNGVQTADYHNVIEYYQMLSDKFSTITMHAGELSDSGKPLHVIIFSDLIVKNNTLDTFLEKKGTSNVLLVNNGIHPGESDGIDASMMLLRDLAQGKISAPKNTIIAIVPVYNIGGALNRNSTSRTNQNGPDEYGFRGNARNYDLNRDFIKADTKNALAFAKIFHALKPELFIDNHVSNGADYQYTITHLFTQHNKLGGNLGTYLHTSFMPALEDSLTSKNWDITPYVNVFNSQPEKGFTQFLDSPRYSTGYTTLFNTLGMMVETHMLKPYKQRVEGTYELMKSFIEIADADAKNISKLVRSSKNAVTAEAEYPIQWQIDSAKTTILNFKGYEGNFVESTITGKQRLKFDQSKPFNKETTYYNFFKPSTMIKVPLCYIVPQGYWNVLERLKANDIATSRFEKDTLMEVEVYRIESYETRRNAYEGHYLHYNTSVATKMETVAINQGDYMISTDQDGVRYILETLEPSAVDSFFNWNFFDTILQQKEGFSPYVWEDKAAALLKNNAQLKEEFDSIKEIDSNFANNWYEQLDWLHKKSSNYEKAHLRYPIVRMRR